MNVDVDFMKENVLQVNGGITIKVDVNVKIVTCVKKIMFGVMLHVVVKTREKIGMYSYLIKCRTKQKHLLQFHDTKQWIQESFILINVL